MRKERAVEALGSASLLLPAWIKAALAANDRLKLLLTLLQSAWQRARVGKPEMLGLAGELRKAGCEDAELLDAIGQQAYLDDDRLVAPGLGRVMQRMRQDLAVMARPVLECAPGASGTGQLPASGNMQGRVEGWLGKLAVWAEGDEMGHDTLVSLTQADRKAGDSLHLLVMDLHKQINALSQTIGTESIDGAHVWQIRDDDVPLVRAFMLGIARTAALKFEHPGLDTAVTRDGQTLLIQNDIGTNDAHVLIVRVTAEGVDVTYSDLHAPRFDFFRDMLQEVGFEWTTDTQQSFAGLNDGKPYQLGHARFAATDQASQCEALEALGARLVFLIDWNRARKRLALFVSKTAAVDLLRMAAREAYGHMAWLLAGGEQLVYGAMQQVDDRLFRIGERLDTALGEHRAKEYLARLMRVASEFMQRGAAISEIEDEARLLLRRAIRQHSVEFDLLADHAATLHALAESLQASLEAWFAGAQPAEIDRLGNRAKEWERRADELLIEARSRLDRRRDPNPFTEMMSWADDVADALEEAHFTLSLMTQADLRVPEPLHSPLQELALATQGAVQDWVRTVETARSVHATNELREQEALLKLIWLILHAERRCDLLYRSVRRALHDARLMDPNALVLIVDLARAIESATDALLFAGHAMRNLTMGRTELWS